MHHLMLATHRSRQRIACTGSRAIVAGQRLHHDRNRAGLLGARRRGPCGLRFTIPTSDCRTRELAQSQLTNDSHARSTLDFRSIRQIANLRGKKWRQRSLPIDGWDRCDTREWSAETAMKAWLPWCLLSAALMVSGCRSTAPPSLPDSSAVAATDAANATWKPITFVDRPELQTGTGVMDADVATEFLKTESGLRYRILRHSDGRKPTADSTVSVHYRGWLSDGTVFDSSYERGKPTTFPLQNVISGWTEGLQLIGQGGMIELWVPSRLGYGEQGSPGSIPAHSTLHFVVELVSVD